LTEAEQDPHIKRLRRRFDRERAARDEAEAIAERVTGQLYSSLQELERVNAALGTVNQELESANQAIRDFVSVASHDLRGPLTSILGFVSTLRRRWDQVEDARKLEFLGTVETQAVRLDRLVGELLTVSSIDAGAVEAHIEEIYLSRTLDEIVRELGDQATGITVGNVPHEWRVRADPDHFHRIVLNYLTNALKYGAPPIETVCEDDGEYVDVIVTDRGSGVPVEFVPRLFEKFARAELASVKAKDGTGLGLSIVLGLARANGGDAWYEPNLPSGSRFGVRLLKAG